jgi:hypothetical protein
MPDLEDADQVATETESAVATEEQPSETKQMDLFSALRMPYYEVPEVKTPTISLSVTQMLGLYDNHGAIYDYQQQSDESDLQFLMRVSQAFHEVLLKELELARETEREKASRPELKIGDIDEMLRCPS